MGCRLWGRTESVPHPWDSPGKNTGVGCHFLLQGIFPDPGIKPRSPALQADSLLRLSCRDQEGRRGSEEAVPGPSVFPSGEPGVSGDFWVRELKQGLCDNLEGWDGEGDGREVQEGRDI